MVAVADTWTLFGSELLRLTTSGLPRTGVFKLILLSVRCVPTPSVPLFTEVIAGGSVIVSWALAGAETPVAEAVNVVEPFLMPVMLNDGEASWPAGTTTLAGEVDASVGSATVRSMRRSPGGAASDSSRLRVVHDEFIGAEIVPPGTKLIVMVLTKSGAEVAVKFAAVAEIVVVPLEMPVATAMAD